MSDLHDAIREQLRTVIDPDLHKDLVTLNMVREIRVKGRTVHFELVLTTNACPVKEQLEEQCRSAACSVDGIDEAEITVRAEVPKSFPKQEQLPGVAHVIAVSSGKGGVGKSTVTANVACALAASGNRVGLLDADIYGPSMPTMMGVKRQPYIRDKKMIPIEAHGVQLMSMGFLVEDEQAMIWRGPMLQGAMRQFITDVHWGELDYLIVDLPPGTGDVQMTLAQNAPLSGAVVVTTPQNVAVADAMRGVTLLHKLEIPLFGIVENMSHYICPQCGHSDAIFGADGGDRFAERIGSRILGRIPLEPSVRSAGDGGTPVVLAAPDSRSAAAFRELAGHIAAQASTHALS